MWEALAAIFGALALLIPIVWTLYNRFWSKKVEEKKRRAKQSKEIAETEEKALKESLTETERRKKDQALEDEGF